MPREDKWVLGLVVFALEYFGAHIAWALMKSWVMVTISVLPK